MKPECAMTCTPDVFQGLDEVRKRRRRPPEGVRPSPRAVEDLEKRLLFALTVNLSSGNMIVTGTSGSDSITIYQDNSVSPNKVYADDDNDTTNDTGFTVNQITGRVRVFGGAGLDTITIESSNYTALGSPVTELCEVYGEAGNDVIWGGDNGDTLQGGDGDDNIRGFGGNDTIYGGYGGEDVLNGQDGNDLIYGGDAGAGGNVEVNADTLIGEDGNDTLYGEGGNDSLEPGGGADFAYGGAGNDTFVGSQGDGAFDWLDGGTGTDNPGDYDATDSLFAFP